MALSGSSIAIVFIGVAACAVAGPVQAGPNTLQQNEYRELADLLARYWEDRRMNQSAKRNLDQIGGGHLVRDIDKSLLNEEESRLTQYLNSASDKQILDTIREKLFAHRFRNGNLINSSINSIAFANTMSHPYNPDLNTDEANDQLFMDQLIISDVPNNAREDDRRIVKNLDQIGGGHLVRNLYQIGGGHLVRNLDQIDSGHLIKNLNQIDNKYLIKNLEQIDSGHLLRNLDQISGENLIRNIDYPNAEMKQRINQPMSISEKLHFTRNLDQIGGGNLVRNVNQIGNGNLGQNLDQIGGGNLVRNLN